MIVNSAISVKFKVWQVTDKEIWNNHLLELWCKEDGCLNLVIHILFWF